MIRICFVSLAALLASSSTWAFQVHRATAPLSTRSSSQLFSTFQTAQGINLHTEAPRNAQAFFDWAGQYGVMPENFQLHTQGDNWGAVAAQNAPAGSRVLFVPAMLRMTSQAAQEQDFAELQPYIAQAIDATTSNGNIALPSHFYLFLKVLQEYELGNQSPYFPWLDAMPRKFTGALNFDDFEMDCLPPFVKFLARRDRYNYDLFKEVLQSLNTPTISPATKNNEEVLKWAFNVVFTRARESFGQAEIIPMSDMLNHRWAANCEVTWDNEGNVNVIALKDLQQGEPLLKCYGQPTNPSRLLATYGFFDASPPATYCKLYPGMVLTPELKNLGFDYERMVFYPENGGIAQEVWDVMLYTILADVDPNVQQQFYQAHMNGDQNTKQGIHQFYMAQTCDALLQHVGEMLSELDECAQTMDQGGMGLQHQHLPMIRRHNEMVRQTFEKVRTNLQQIRASAQ